MNKYGLTFHHLGLAVKNPDQARVFLQGMDYVIHPEVFDPLQNVNLQMAVHTDMPEVEIIYPAAGKGPLDKLLNKHKEGLVYHVCYTAPDIPRCLAALEADGLQVFCVVPAKPAVLFDGQEVSFYLVNEIGLIEIIDESSSTTA